MQLPIQQQVYSYLPSKLASTKPSHDSRFREDLGMDQIDFFELVIRLENLYHVRIPDADLEQVKTVQQLITCLNDQVVGQRWNCCLAYGLDDYARICELLFLGFLLWLKTKVSVYQPLTRAGQTPAGVGSYAVYHSLFR